MRIEDTMKDLVKKVQALKCKVRPHELVRTQSLAQFTYRAQCTCCARLFHVTDCREAYVSTNKKLRNKNISSEPGRVTQQVTVVPWGDHQHDFYSDFTKLVYLKTEPHIFKERGDLVHND